jgi:hypothetical protein
MPTRRDVVALGAASLILLLAKTYEAYGAELNIEIVALTHYPVRDALKPVRDFLGTLGSQVKVVEFDAGSADGEKRIQAVGLKGHVPIVLLINGSDKFKRADGTQIEFKDFPAKVGNPLGLNGSWSVADFEAAVNAALGK